MRYIRSEKLSDWCLKIIVENLDAIINSKTTPQRLIDFLHRVYSKQVFREYSSCNAVSESDMIWFLNPYSKSIKLSVVSEKVFSQLRIVGATITDLNLKDSLASENILNAVLCCVPSVKYLDLRYTSCSDKTLLLLKRICPELINLTLKGCHNISCEGMKNLCDGGNLKLEYLDITNTKLHYKGLRIILREMSTLQCLKYDNLGDAFYHVHKYELKESAYSHVKYNLIELRYTYSKDCDIETVILAWTVMCPKVKKVHFECPVSERVLEICTKFKYLEELRIEIANHFMGSVDAITPILPLARNIKTLILCCMKVPVHKLIENFVNLQCLFLCNVEFTDFSPEDIKITELKLSTLIFKDNSRELSSTSLKALSVLISLSKNVTDLKLNCTSDLPESIFFMILNSMKKLVFVDLSYCNVKMDFVVQFFQLPTVKQICLDLCKCYFSFDKYSALRNIDKNCSPSTLSWQPFLDNSDDSDSDILSDG